MSEILLLELDFRGMWIECQHVNITTDVEIPEEHHLSLSLSATKPTPESIPAVS